MSFLTGFNLEQGVMNLNLFEFVCLTFLSFTVLYFSFCTFSYFIFKKMNLNLVQRKDIKSGQIRTEIKRSFVSITMFALLAVPMHFGLQSGFYKFNYQFNFSVFLLEALVLFFWNEIYFYLFHRLFHVKWLYKYHFDHHYSNVPTPFSAYSFHWSEGMILGAVMPVVMIFYDFQIYSIALLPLMSIVMNVLGHSNVDFFQDKKLTSLYSFSKRHSLHHKNPHTNFGFFLPVFDMLFGTTEKPS